MHIFQHWLIQQCLQKALSQLRIIDLIVNTQIEFVHFFKKTHRKRLIYIDIIKYF